MFPGWYGGKNRGNARLDQKPGQNPVLLEGVGNGDRKPGATKETCRIDRRNTAMQEMEAGTRWEKRACVCFLMGGASRQDRF